MRSILILISLLSLAACAGTFQTASISEAYKKYEAEDYNSTLVLISRAENIKSVTPEMKAELTFLKAQAYESLNQIDKASSLYKYLTEHHSHSEYSYLALNKLENL